MKLVIGIATRNRAKVIKEVLLPSFLKQTSNNFEVIFMDASDNDETKEIIHHFIDTYRPKFGMHYFRARKKGLPSQRNEIIDIFLKTHGDILAFFDDDVYLSPNTVDTILKEFKNENLYALGLIINHSNTSKNRMKPPIRYLKELAKFLYTRIFLINLSNDFDKHSPRKVFISGWNIGSNYPGEAQWLSGCAMIYRRAVFESFSLRFNEKLEAFGGWAYGEDVEFSHKLWRILRQEKKNKESMKIAPESFVIHYNTPGGRPNLRRKYAMMIYNRYLILKGSIVPYCKFKIVPYLAFIWSLIGFCLLTVVIGTYHGNLKERIQGILLGVKSIFLSDKGHLEELVRY